MSFGISPSDFVTIPDLVWKIYRACKDSGGVFQEVESVLSSFHVVLKETDELIKEGGLNAQRESHLEQIRSDCRAVLDDLECLLKKYDSLGTQTQRTWDRLRWGLENINAISVRIIHHTGILTAFNTTLTSLSQIRIEKLLRKLVVEVRDGTRHSSVVSTHTVDSLTMTENEVWQKFRRELEDIGLSAAVLTEKKEFIISWLKNAVAQGELDEIAEASNNDTLDLVEQLSKSLAHRTPPPTTNEALETPVPPTAPSRISFGIRHWHCGLSKS
ncbi:hypothetical protein K440DRAFT_553579 [Wilcoxina mikolae CBS 423.85]|nr:hypothetical protein K440DRAFT_553579 [Wilcoxina mikolae CBS 423.85]